MILANLTRAIREQNYYAVVLEFLIVIAGVVIGFQITEWRSSQAHFHRSEMAKHRMLSEARSNVEYLSFAIDAAHFRIEELDYTAQAIDGVIEEIDEERFQIGARSAGLYPAITPQRSVYDELSASGLGEFIENQTVRDAIGAYYSRLAFTESQLQYWRDYTTLAYLTIRQLGNISYNAASSRRVSYSLNMELAFADPAFSQYVLDDLRNQIIFQEYRWRLYDLALDMCEAIASDILAECNSRSPDTRRYDE